VTFVLARPDSFLWAPYDRYIQIDLGYAHPDGFVRAQAIMSLLELGLVALALAWRRRASGVLLAIVASALTAAKTILIFTIELVTGGQHVGHNATSDLVLLYVAPNVVWVVVPIVVSVVLGRRLIAEK
jgi:hypothetical protein